MTVALTKPTGVERHRSVNFEWEIGEKDGKAIFAVLSVSHHKAGANMFTGERTTEDYFGVSLQNETREDRGNGIVMRGFKLFAGLGIARIPAGNRYSAKKLREAAEQGYETFLRIYESGDPRVLRYFDGEYDPRGDDS